MRILYYSHHHGSGHARNAQYFYSVLKEKLHVVTSSSFSFDQEMNITILQEEKESENDFLGGREMLPGYLHYSPVGNQNILNRSSTILNICIQENIDLAIVDLSVEVAALLRVASVPFAYVRLPGNRTDTAHLECYKAASFLLAYYPEELEDMDTPQWIIDKTIYLGFLSNLDSAPASVRDLPKSLLNKKNIILVVKGYGGHEEVDAGVKELKHNLKGYYVSVGPLSDEYKEIYDYKIDYSTNVKGLMAVAERIVIPPSLNLTAEALNSNKPVTVIPSERHFDEHEVMAKNLVRCGYADTPNQLKHQFKEFVPIGAAQQFLNNLKEFEDLQDLVNYYEIEIL